MISIEFLEGDDYHEINWKYRFLYGFLLQPTFNYLLPSTLIPRLMDNSTVFQASMTHKASHKALEALYQPDSNGTSQTWKQQILQSLFLNSGSVKGVQNRLRLVSQQIVDFLRKETSVPDSRPCRVLSMASGSGRSLISSLEQLVNEGHIMRRIDVTFVDSDKNALECSRRLLRDSFIANHDQFHFEWLQDEVSEFLEIRCLESHYNLIEMIGFLDYLQPESVIRMLRLVNRSLCNNGVLIASNILRNPEQRFMEKIVKWGLIHRTPEELEDIWSHTPFLSTDAPCSTRILIEPMRFHAVVVSRCQDP